MEFKLDTGAEVTAISEATYKEAGHIATGEGIQHLIWADPSKSESLRTVHRNIGASRT